MYNANKRTYAFTDAIASGNGYAMCTQLSRRWVIPSSGGVLSTCRWMALARYRYRLFV
ncbi:MAG: hypothetical protein AAF974_07475 [Cyanobacteria bacterium P01_E01_bin.34]